MHAVVPVVAGIVRMPLRRFATWAGIGAVVWSAVYTSVGAAAGSAYREYGHLGLVISARLLLIAAAAIAVRRRNRDAEATTHRHPTVTSAPAFSHPSSSSCAEGHETTSGARR